MNIDTKLRQQSDQNYRKHNEVIIRPSCNHEGKNEIDIPYVKKRATIGRSLIFNTNSFASKILTLLTKIVYMYLKVVLGKVFQQ